MTTVSTKHYLQREGLATRWLWFIWTSASKTDWRFQISRRGTIDLLLGHRGLKWKRVMSFLQTGWSCCQSQWLVGREGDRSRVTGALDTFFDWQLASWAPSEGCFYLSLWHLEGRWKTTKIWDKVPHELYWSWWGLGQPVLWRDCSWYTCNCKTKKNKKHIATITSSNFLALYCSAPFMKFSRMTSQRTVPYHNI